MVVQNRISVELAQEEIDDIIARLQELGAMMPFLVGMSTAERNRLNKAGDRSIAFIRRCHDVAPLIQDYLPRGLDIDEMRKDIELVDSLRRIAVVVSQLHERLTDTHALAVSEAYSAALEVYRAAKKAREREGMDNVVAELARRFENHGPKRSTQTDADTDADTAGNAAGNAVPGTPTSSADA